MAKPLEDAIDKADAEVVAGDCHLANGAILEETGRRPRTRCSNWLGPTA